MRVEDFIKAVDGREASVSDLRMASLHESHLGLDWLMLLTMVDHYIAHPDVTPDDVLANAPNNYLVDTDTEVSLKDVVHPDDVDLFTKPGRSTSRTFSCLPGGTWWRWRA